MALLPTELQRDVPWKGLESEVECKSDILSFRAAATGAFTPENVPGAGQKSPSGNIFGHNRACRLLSSSKHRALRQAQRPGFEFVQTQLSVTSTSSAAG